MVVVGGRGCVGGRGECAQFAIFFVIHALTLWLAVS